jgi:hypothetical protein
LFDPFGKRKKQRQQEQIRQLMAHRARVARFAKLFASGKAEPYKIYDLKTLGGLTKAQIEASIQVWHKACQLKPEMALPDVDLAELLPKLSQFQPGVGATPLGLNPFAIAAMDPKTQMKQMQAMCATAKMPDDALRIRVRNERERLRRAAAEMTGKPHKPVQKGFDFNKFFVTQPNTPNAPTKSTPAPAPAPTIHTQTGQVKRLPLGLHKRRD